jgi:hypothetical protein
MVRTVDMGKRMIWRERLQRFNKWTGTVAQFCAKERVSVASFYQWRRKLESNDVHNSETRRAREAGSRSHAAGQGGRQHAAKNSPRTGGTFVPVQVVGSSVVEVLLVEGSRLLIPADATSALQTVVRALSAGSAMDTQDSGGRRC